jgi:hypothetical protein
MSFRFHTGSRISLRRMTVLCRVEQRISTSKVGKINMEKEKPLPSS